MRPSCQAFSPALSKLALSSCVKLSDTDCQNKELERLVAYYPKIEGFPDPPLITKPHTPPLSDKEYNLWTVWFEDVDTTVKDLWVLEVRFEGEARATGGFYLEPERNAMTYPCNLEMYSGKLEVGPSTAAVTANSRW